MKRLFTLLLCWNSLSLPADLAAHSHPSFGKGKTNTVCAAAQRQIDQRTHRIRARLSGGGDCWWDPELQDAYLITVQKTGGNPEEVSLLKSAGIWMGGMDPVGNLKLACQNGGQGNRPVDFWPGPLDAASGVTDSITCKNWDQHFSVSADEIRLHVDQWEQGTRHPASIPNGVKYWPARGNPFFTERYGFSLPHTSQGLAPFFDRDGDMLYNPQNGDYPTNGVRSKCASERFPETLYFRIFNDQGGGAFHGVSQGNAIGMEVHATYFSYKTGDESDQTTYQNYRLIHRGAESIDSFFFAYWVSPALGCPLDDYFGFDPDRNLAYLYNRDELDGYPTDCACDNGPNASGTFCEQVPMLGISLIEGPLKQVENDPNGPASWLPIGVSHFMYYVGSESACLPAGVNMAPALPHEFFNYMTGRWRDGTPLTYGGTGYDVSSTQFTPFAFPDAPNQPGGWSMCGEGAQSGCNRNFIMSVGPLQFQPGDVNQMLWGVPIAENVPLPCPDLTYLQRMDQKTKAIFDCLEQLTPDPPQLDWIALDQQLIAVLSNEPTSNNYLEKFRDNALNAPDSLLKHPDTAQREKAAYHFEGYKIYQLLRPDLRYEDLDNPELARLVFQTDKKNGITKAFNWQSLPDPKDPENPYQKVWYPVEMVSGADLGLQHTVSITEDQFNTGNIKSLVNHKRYYFTVVAYAYNQFGPFQPKDWHLGGQVIQYIDSGEKMEVYTVIPHPTVDQILHSAFGDSPSVTRLAGVGVGGRFLELDPASRMAMLSPDFDGSVTYLPGKSPIQITIFNPLEVTEGEYEITFENNAPQDSVLPPNTGWLLSRMDENGQLQPVGPSNGGIMESNETIFKTLGFSVTITQTGETGNYIPALTSPDIVSPGKKNGAIGANIRYLETQRPWLSGIPDFSEGVFNFVKTGIGEKDYRLDPEQALSQLGQGFFIPYCMASGILPDGPLSDTAFPRLVTPAWTGKVGGHFFNDQCIGLISKSDSLIDYHWIRQTPNIDIVLTPDTNLWSRCIVVETASEYYTGGMLGVVKDPDLITDSGPGRIRQSFDTRFAYSVGKADKDGDGLPDRDLVLEPEWIPNTNPGADGFRDNPIKGADLRGMGWFPGYAVDVETGQRLNIFFGENSCYSAHLDPAFTGRDMLWNPTDQWFRQTGGVSEISDFLLGGQHWIYVSRTPYDSCATLRAALHPDYWPAGLKNLRKREAIRQIAWAGMITLAPNTPPLQLAKGLVPEETWISLRVDNPFGVQNNQGVIQYPKYRFNIRDMAPSPIEQPMYNSILDTIKVVPNPYYGFSQYESASDQQVAKITNLPATCTVTIYDLNGVAIRQFKRQESYAPYRQYPPDLEWDLKNQNGKQIASGVYLIHVQAGALGEKTLKWFCVPRWGP